MDYNVKGTIMRRMWQGILPCLVTVDERRLLEHEDLGTARELANAHCLFKPPPIYPKGLAELYKRMLCHFGPAVELQNLGVLFSALVGQQSWACREVCKEKKAVIGDLDRAKVYLKTWQQNAVKEVFQMFQTEKAKEKEIYQMNFYFHWIAHNSGSTFPYGNSNPSPEWTVAASEKCEG